MLLAALRRFLVLLALSAGITAGLSILVGAFFYGASTGRSVSVGFYLVGSFLLIAGFFVGNRGPARLKRDHDAVPFFGARALRWATAEEREDAINTSAIFVVLGIVLIVLGIFVDSRYRLI